MRTKHRIAAAFRIRGEEDKHYIKGTCSISGTSGDSYRGELLGICILLSIIKYIEEHNSTYRKGFINIHCDNLEAVRMSNRDNIVISVKKNIIFDQSDIRNQVSAYHRSQV